MVSLHMLLFLHSTFGYMKQIELSVINNGKQQVHRINAYNDSYKITIQDIELAYERRK